MSQVIHSSVNPAAVQALVDRFGEPTWAKGLRTEAVSIYEQVGLPKKDEGWRNLRLKDVPLDAIVPYTDAKAVPDSIKSRIDESSAGVLIHYNSDVVEARLAPELVQKGVILMSLQDAITKHPEKVQKYLTTLYPVNESKFSALHYALRTGGMFLYVPKNVVIDQPIQLLTFSDEPNVAVCNHTLVVAEANSQVRIIEFSGADLKGGSIVHSGAVEIFAEDGAHVSFTALQSFDSGVYSINPRRARVGRNADVQWAISELGGRIVRSENTSYVEGDGGNSNAAVVFFGSGEQQLDVSAAMIHRGTNGTSDIIAKGVMTDKAKTIWRGLGHIANGAKGCKTFQTENSLILSDKAKGDAIPGLLIEETDVVGAGHAATVGRIDEAHLFYLQSRGITEKQAQRMIVEGFFGGVIQKIPVEIIRNEVHTLIDRKLGW